MSLFQHPMTALRAFAIVKLYICIYVRACVRACMCMHEFACIHVYYISIYRNE